MKQNIKQVEREDAQARMSQVIGAVVTLVLSLAVLFILIPLGVTEPSSIKSPLLSPALLPRVLSAFIAILALAWLIQALRPLGTPGAHEGIFARAPRFWLRLASVLIIIFSSAILINPLGILTTSIFSMVALMAIGGERLPIRFIVAGVILPTLVWLFFYKIAQVPLPLGPIERMLFS